VRETCARVCVLSWLTQGRTRHSRARSRLRDSQRPSPNEPAFDPSQDCERPRIIPRSAKSAGERLVKALSREQISTRTHDREPFSRDARRLSDKEGAQRREPRRNIPATQRTPHARGKDERETRRRALKTWNERRDEKEGMRARGRESATRSRHEP